MDAVAHVAQETVSLDEPIGATGWVDPVFKMGVIVAIQRNIIVEDFNVARAARTSACAPLHALLGETADGEPLKAHMVGRIIKSEPALIGPT